MTKFTMEPTQQTKWRIGNEYYGLCYHIIMAHYKQHRFSIRLKPADITFEFIRMRTMGGKVTMELSFFSFKLSMSIQI